MRQEVVMFLNVTEITYVDGYRLRLKFNDGKVKEVNLESELYGEIFEPLKGFSLFRKATINPDTHTLDWPNGADFASEFLYEIGIESRKTA
jgi:hypothetical protein